MCEANSPAPNGPLPGTAVHQALLATIIEHCRNDARIAALVLFGSLGRDDWDAFSDLDLAAIVQPDAAVAATAEIAAIARALHECGYPVLFTQVVGSDGYLVLRELTGIAISFQRLDEADPGIADGMRVLCGKLPAASLVAAAQANARAPLAPNDELHRFLWLALDADIKLQRRQFWNALPRLNRMRDALVAIFAITRGARRNYRFFEAEASGSLKAAFGSTLPHYDATDPNAALRAQRVRSTTCCRLVETGLDELSNGQLMLGAGEAETIQAPARAPTDAAAQPVKSPLGRCSTEREGSRYEKRYPGVGDEKSQC